LIEALIKMFSKSRFYWAVDVMQPRSQNNTF